MIAVAARAITAAKPVAIPLAQLAMLYLVVCFFRSPRSTPGRAALGVCRCVFWLSAAWYLIGGTVFSPYNLHRFSASPWLPIIDTLLVL